MRQTMRFGTLDISFDERVLRPRAWTQEQARWAAELLADATTPEGPVLEMCSGAGHIGLLTIALQPRGLVEVREADLEAALRPGEYFSLVVADPPWVPSERTSAFPEDPLGAIDGGSDGLDVARVCLRVAASHLLSGGSILLQLGGEDQVAALVRELDGLTVRETRAAEGGILVRLVTDPS